MKKMFTRSSKNPILRPNPKKTWENFKVYNPTIFYDGRYHLFYRAMNKGDNWRSCIGYAVSKDGEHFKRLAEPVLVPNTTTEKRGVEDPRISKIGNTYHMMYAGYDGTDVCLCTATSKDLLHWKKQGKALRNFSFVRNGGRSVRFIDGKPVDKTDRKKTKEWSKAGGLFPVIINKKYWLLFGEFCMWLAHSSDGKKFKVYKNLIKPRKGNYFDNVFVEMGPAPILTSKGWLVLYHGVDKTFTYRLGFLLLDAQNPARILYRSKQAIFEPEEQYEIKGLVDVMPGGLAKLQQLSQVEIKKYIAEIVRKKVMPKVTFCCGAVVVGGVLRIYYGAADSVVCTASAKLSDILEMVG